MAENGPSSASSPEPALRKLANAYLQFCQSHPNYFRLIAAFDRGRFEESISPELYQQVLDKSVQGLGLLAETIEMGKESGLFCVDDSWRAAGSTWAALNGVMVLMAHPLRRRMLESDVETMFGATLDLVIRGLKDCEKRTTKEESA
jgi:hypothetical protein